MAILGLMTTEQVKDTMSENARRRVFYHYPEGKFPLAGLLSLMEDQETDKNNFAWFEERWTAPKSLTAAANAAGPFTNTSDADLTTGGWSQAINTTIKIKVADATIFRLQDIVSVIVPDSGSSTQDVRGVVTAINSSTNKLTVRLTQAVTNALNTSAANSLYCYMISSIAPQAETVKEGGGSFPTEINNYTQIVRTVVGPFSRTALAMGQRFDKSGDYRQENKKAMIRHMVALEQMILWGRRRLYTSGTNSKGSTVPEYETGGIEWFLEQWDKGTTGNGGAFDYRPGGTDLTSVSWESYEDKRVIDLNSGNISETQFDEIIRRLFKVTNNSTYEKLGVCDSKFLAKFNAYCKRASVATRMLSSKEDSYGMTVTEWITPHGRIFLKTHPLFNDQPRLQNSCWFIDIGKLALRPLTSGKTVLLKNRQDNSYDGRIDEWLTEAGLFFESPESCMIIKNLGGITI